MRRVSTCRLARNTNGFCFFFVLLIFCVKSLVFAIRVLVIGARRQSLSLRALAVCRYQVSFVFVRRWHVYTFRFFLGSLPNWSFHFALFDRLLHIARLEFVFARRPSGLWRAKQRLEAHSDRLAGRQFYFLLIRRHLSLCASYYDHVSANFCVRRK